MCQSYSLVALRVSEWVGELALLPPVHHLPVPWGLSSQTGLAKNSVIPANDESQFSKFTPNQRKYGSAERTSASH